jgi:hypothetical protein
MRIERREYIRAVPTADGPLARLRLRTGHDLVVLDISERGARVEGLARLLPGTGVEVHMVAAEGRVRIRSRVVRSRVCRLSAASICYESALTFDVALDGVFLLTHRASLQGFEVM